MMRAMVGVIRMDAVCVPARGVRTVLAVRASGIKLGHDLGEQFIGVPSSPGTTLEPILPVPISFAPQVFIPAVEQHQSRMRHQPHHVFPSFSLDLLPER